ncbi:MAG: PilZ domain-containing protein [Thermodesulfobacteriota bacterium]
MANPKSSIDLTQVTQQKVEGTTLSIEVGARWRIKPAASDKVYECTYVGSIYPTHLLATLPVSAGVREILLPERVVNVSFLHEDYNICKFETQVKAIVTTPFQAVCYEYPEFFYALNLRRHERAVCALPCACVYNRQTLQGTALNISRGGAKIAFLGDDAAALREVEDSAPVVVGAKLLHGGEDVLLAGLVKKVVRDDAGVALGLMFADLPPEQEQALQRYVEISRYVARYRFD